MRGMRFGALPLLIVLAAGVGACAAILGFEDAKDLDGGAATADAAGSDLEVTPAEGAPGVVCVPRPPPEWRGPLAISEARGDPLPALIDCPAPYAKPHDFFSGLQASPATCDCKCAAPTGLACSDPVVTVFPTKGACDADAGACATPYSPPKTCANNDYPPASGTCPATNTEAKITTPAAPTAGACAPSAGEVVAPARWTGSARLCEPPPSVPGTCPPEKVPTPATGAPYQTNYCVYSTGTALCPVAYPVQRLYHARLTDTRKCACTCGAPTGVSCGGTVIGYDNVGCGGSKKTVTSSCVGMGNTSVIVLEGSAPSGGSCPTGGGPTGEAKAEDPVTVCCRR